MSGCAASDRPAAPLPPLPADLVEGCPLPEVVAEDARLAAARNRAAARACAARHADTVSFYEDLKEGVR